MLRREFVGKLAAAGAAFTLLPATLLGKSGRERRDPAFKLTARQLVIVAEFVKSTAAYHRRRHDPAFPRVETWGGFIRAGRLTGHSVAQAWTAVRFHGFRLSDPIPELTDYVRNEAGRPER